MKKRKSLNCPKFCDSIGCYETYEERVCGGKKVNVWVLHCKTLEKIHKQINKKR